LTSAPEAPRNVPAGLAFVLGLASLVPLLGAVLGPAALVLGALGLARARRLPGGAGFRQARLGVILGLVSSAAHAIAIGTR
jgi:hypothetical protein